MTGRAAIAPPSFPRADPRQLQIGLAVPEGRAVMLQV